MRATCCTVLALLAAAASPAAASRPLARLGSSRPLVRPPARPRMSSLGGGGGGGGRDQRELRVPQGNYVSKSPQQLQAEAQLRQQQMGGMSRQQLRTQMRRSRVSTGGSSDAVLQSGWFSKAKGGMVGITIAAALSAAGWQAQRLFRGRQRELIDACAATMVYHGESSTELEATVRSFKGQLGPGPYTPRLFSRYIAQLATDRPAGGAAIRAVRLAQRAFGVPDAAVPAAFEAAAEEHLADRPSVLGKLVFIAERAVGNPASVASLRGRLPYGAEYVDSLQRMMLEKTFKEAVLKSSADLLSASVPAAEAQALGLSMADAEGLLERFRKEEAEVQRKAAAEADEVEAAERARLDLLAKVQAESPVEEAPPPPPPPPPAADAPPPAVGDLKGLGGLGGAVGGLGVPPEAPAAPDAAPPSTDAPAPGGAAGDAPAAPSDGAEYECGECGYTLFPAAGREWKFFGDDFKCPQCGAPKSAFKNVGGTGDGGADGGAGAAGAGRAGSDDDYEPATM